MQAQSLLASIGGHYEVSSLGSTQHVSFQRTIGSFVQKRAWPASNLRDDVSSELSLDVNMKHITEGQSNQCQLWVLVIQMSCSPHLWFTLGLLAMVCCVIHTLVELLFRYSESMTSVSLNGWKQWDSFTCHKIIFLESIEGPQVTNPCFCLLFLALLPSDWGILVVGVILGWFTDRQCPILH